MEIKQIEERITKKEAQIAKIEKRIAKWEAAKSDQAFKKEYKFWEQGGMYYNQFTQTYNRTYEDFRAERWESYITSCDREIHSANRDLEEAHLQLAKYNNLLKLEQVKQAKLSEERIQVLMDFLESWKQKVINYTHENVKLIPKYFAADAKACEFRNNEMWRMEDQAAAKAKYKELRQEANDIKELIADLTFEVYRASAENSTNDTKLNEILDKEIERKYLKLIDSITAKVGEITDTSCLKIGIKGDIEGYITGTQGKVRIETIGAGGYNNNIILDSGRHGQCYHFRTLINKVK